MKLETQTPFRLEARLWDPITTRLGSQVQYLLRGKIRDGLLYRRAENTLRNSIQRPLWGALWEST